MSILKIVYMGLGDKDFCVFNGIKKKSLIDSKVLVNTARGKRVAIVVDVLDDIVEYKIDNKFIKFLNGKDLKIALKNRRIACDALSVAREYAANMELNMGFVASEYTFDRKQLIFLFVADTRIDFRNLAKALAQKYKTRIELRQIGVRDKASMIGGLGPCGLTLCCNTFFNEFISVSINMAKNQMLALNPNKINGICGRLLCCLNYENEFYTEMKEKFPSVGSFIKVDEEDVKVIFCDYMRDSINVERNNGDIITVKVDWVNNTYEKII